MTIHPPNFGRYWEDFVVGDIFKHWPGRTISEVDNTWFTLLTMNTHPLHFDANYASGTMFGRPLVVSTFTLATVVGMSVRDTSQNAVANLGWSNISMPHPVFVGDTLYAESKVLAKRESKSRPGTGLITILTTGYNQDNELVITFERTILMRRRGYDDDRLPVFGSRPAPDAPE